MRLVRRRQSLAGQFGLGPDETALASRCLGGYWYMRDTDFEQVDQLARRPAEALRTGKLLEERPIVLDSRAEELMRRELTHGLLSCAAPPPELPPPAADMATELLRALSVPIDEYGVTFSRDPDEAVVQVGTAFARIAHVEDSNFSTLLVASPWRDGFLGTAAHILHPIFSMARLSPTDLQRRMRDFEGRLSPVKRDSFGRSLRSLSRAASA